MLMCTLGAKNEDATLKLLGSLRDFIRYGKFLRIQYDAGKISSQSTV